MSYEFKKLSEVESLNEVPKAATVLAEVDGAIKRIPSSGLGGVVKTAIIKDNTYDNLVAWFSGQSDDSPEPSNEFYCLNMTFEEVYETISSCEPITFVVMANAGLPVVSNVCTVGFFGVKEYPMPCFCIQCSLGFNNLMLYWTADGISTEEPNIGGGAD